jgi:hypothetical protein
MVDIVSQGETVEVTDAQLEEIQAHGITWFEYCLWRQTLDHAQAIATLLGNSQDSQDG